MKTTLAGLALLLVSATSALAEWKAERFADASTLEILTVGPEEGEHWSTVWMVVLEGEVYVRLGKRAATRVEKSETRPFASVRFDGRIFERVRLEPAPDEASAVAEAMAEKYWTDPLVRWIDHPLTLRLVPTQPAS